MMHTLVSLPPSHPRRTHSLHYCPQNFDHLVRRRCIRGQTAQNSGWWYRPKSYRNQVWSVSSWKQPEVRIISSWA